MSFYKDLSKEIFKRTANLLEDELSTNKEQFHFSIKNNDSNKIHNVSFLNLYNNIRTLLINEGFDNGGGNSLIYPSAELIIDNEHDIFNLLLIINDSNDENGVNPINHYISFGDILNHIHTNTDNSLNLTNINTIINNNDWHSNIKLAINIKTGDTYNTHNLNLNVLLSLLFHSTINLTDHTTVTTNNIKICVNYTNGNTYNLDLDIYLKLLFEHTDKYTTIFNDNNTFNIQPINITYNGDNIPFDNFYLLLLHHTNNTNITYKFSLYQIFSILLVYFTQNKISFESISLISDRRFKENILPITNCLDKIEQLEPKTFNYKGKEKSKHIGFIAQDILETDISYIIDKSSKKQLKVEYNSIIGLLTGGIKELKSEVKESKDEVNKLKSEVKESKDEVNKLKSEVKESKDEVNKLKNEVKESKENNLFLNNILTYNVKELQNEINELKNQNRLLQNLLIQKETPLK